MSRTVIKYIIFIAISLLITFNGIAGGLKLKGNTHPIDMRTSYNVFSEKEVIFNDFFEIDFYLSLYPDIDRERDSGYIIRIKNKENNRIFNLFYDGRGEDNFIFRLNEEGKQSLINADFNKDLLTNQRWFKVNILFNLNDDSVTLRIGNMVYNSQIDSINDKIIPIIMFGKSDHVIDTPEFAIRDLRIGDEKKHHFILNEFEGTEVHDSKEKVVGNVVNPEWLKNDAYHWKLEALFYSESIAGSNFNSKTGEIYFFNSDSIIIHNLHNSQTRRIKFEEECPVRLELGTNFIDTLENKLYSYEVYIDDSLYNGPTVASLDLSTFRWSVESYDLLPRQYHHHTSFYDSASRQLIIFGGFGNMYYSDNFYSYNIDNKKWNLLEIDNNDIIFPRYFTSSGYSENDNSLYIYGGMGNESGEQLIGREYFYDLYKVDLATYTITKEWEINWNDENVVPVRNMIIDDENNFYTLNYPEYFSNSFLMLSRFSILTGNYEHVGDSIEIYSDRISTHANLYFDKNQMKLFTLIHQFEDDIASELNIYSIDFPPITKEDMVPFNNTKRLTNTYWVLLSLFVLMLLSAAIIYKRSRKDKKKKYIRRLLNDNITLSNSDVDTKTGKGFEIATKANSIYLFGEFTIINKKNRDITYMFSNRLKQTLVLILHYSIYDNGMSSQHLSKVLWPEKSVASAKNSRNVTLSNLRKNLNELDGIELVYSNGLFKLEINNPVYCDLIESINIINSETIETKELLNIINRGKFLKFEDNPIFDPIKSSFEKSIEPVLQLEIEKAFDNRKYPETIELAKALFNIDPVNKKAFRYQINAMQKTGLNEEAKIRYIEFTIEYKKIIGEDYHDNDDFQNI